MDEKKICKIINYKPNKWQEIVRQSNARFKIIVAGRRAGKTKFVAEDPRVGLVNWLHRKNKTIWVVAPNYDLTDRVWEVLVKLLNTKLAALRKDIFSSRGRQRIVTKLGTTIEAKSADDPRSLVGKGLDFLVCDESALIDQKAWTESLRPSLMDKKGSAIFIGTPKRKNWFYDLYLRGLNPEEKEYQSWRFSSFENDYLDKEELNKIVLDMPELEYQQEIEADFLEGVGQFFRKIKDCVTGELENCDTNHYYYLGVDLGRLRDFTVLTVMDGNTNQLVYFDRFKEVDWNLQKARIEAVARRYNNAQVIIDSTGVGDPIVQNLMEIGLAVEDFKLTSISKKQVLDKLSILIEQNRISFPEIPILLSELEEFGYWETRTGRTSYSAPPGKNDDTVISLALACWRLEKKEIVNKTQELSRFKELREPQQITNPFHFNL